MQSSKYFISKEHVKGVHTFTSSQLNTSSQPSDQKSNLRTSADRGTAEELLILITHVHVTLMTAAVFY